MFRNAKNNCLETIQRMLFRCIHRLEISEQREEFHQPFFLQGCKKEPHFETLFFLGKLLTNRFMTFSHIILFCNYFPLCFCIEECTIHAIYMAIRESTAKFQNCFLKVICFHDHISILIWKMRIRAECEVKIFQLNPIFVFFGEQFFSCSSKALTQFFKNSGNSVPTKSAKIFISPNLSVLNL